MQTQNRKFLQFNGRTLLFLSVDGTYWVALKPICEALGVNYDRQYKNLKTDEILSGVYAKQPMHDTSGRVQEMISLPEKWVYGWLFSIRSDSEELKAFKRECYQVLYDHFHGPLAERLQVLQTKSAAQLEVEKWEAELQQTEAYRNLQAARQKLKGTGKDLSKLDVKLAGQLDIFS